MHAVWVKGVKLPLSVGGHVGLDFCNTYAGWDKPQVPAGERLETYDAFVLWGLHNGLYDEAAAARLRRTAARDSVAASEVMTRARSFRTNLHTVLLDPTRTRALAAVSGVVREAGSLGSLATTPDGPRWRLGRAAGLLVPMLHVAHEAEYLLTSPARDDISVCPGHDCGWLFLDPRGRRRWCIMSSCGNRSKVAAHAARARHQEAESA